MARTRHLALGVVLTLACLAVCFSGGSQAAAAGERPAIVLAAFGTSTAAVDTYRHIEALARERFPEHDIHWAFTSRLIREKLRREGRQELKDVPRTLRDLKAAGVSRVAVQSLHVVPGEEWQKMVQESRQVPGLKVALGKPLLSSETDRSRVLAALAKDFPADLQNHAVVLAGHGSPHPDGEAAYLALDGLVRSRFFGQNVFLGVIAGNPPGEAALEAVKGSQATAVVLTPLMVVAGEHVKNDILGEEPDSWQSRLLAQRHYQIQGVTQGLGYRDEVVAVFLDHLEEALAQLTP
jgi:sirohydrochlorin cobaltochelatase